ncbi:MAG: hypothetical protein A2Y62_18865 [Candidatus Fischerbacteria bacterium RBG_13_37_8]|uniref:Uncharacterized protein n=1 Tax=Candidatus Fischerbacteria bacterium RBG_13_37_8 TaxID=1817863 RepID=A0A1F5VYC4_9BACT|nr:MAG: hypothetical protein A2Y62_18865 [Candidatus Fischerbacteria bacterium RBG_13_37_8]
MKKKYIIILFILIIIIGVVLWFTMLKSKNNNGMEFKVENIQRGDIEALVVTTGTLNPVNIVDVGSQVSGRIKNIYVDFNSKVKEGEVIAELDPELFLTRVKESEANYQHAQASLEKAKVNLANIKKQYERALELFEKDLVSFEAKENTETQYYSAKSDVQSAEAGLEQAKSQLESIKVDLKYTIIKSPIEGIVINRNINVGQTVAASFQAPVLFQIANDLNKMQVECSVDEADIGKVQEGQKVRFTVDAFPDQNFIGTVSQVRYSPEIIQNVVTYTTIVAVENQDMKLRPGMTANASIIVGEAKNALLIPNAALRFTPELKPEEMKKIFEEARSETMGKPGDAPMPGSSPAGQQHSPQGNASNNGSHQRPPGGKMKNFSRAWIINDKGKLTPLFLKIGVTDNNYTEILRGNFKEGQPVIIGTNSTGNNPGPGGMGGIMRGLH